MKLEYSAWSGVVIVCPDCGHWRGHYPSRGSAWIALARHYKESHGDYHAAEKARLAARKVRDSS
ncbi:hypothetical protein QP992_00360 [Corynebacterium ulcerans]|uniref:hypothetical protein n=1 Tax=Corynebacterium ulcerans TaxID=65058 RepID=UPI0002FDD7E5|nr:hypothetical protein [Corynebacterium ulcerans]MDK8887595.1 hypothetical protein [Corynebacterium ulcerans]